MPAKSPGTTQGGVRKGASETVTTRRHRFEPFTRRISRLKIDPVHRVQSVVPSDNASDFSQSFFRTALDEWAELNLSRTFTSFLTKVNPLSENLPQLLHEQTRIFDLLAEHIERRDDLALEPLLSLTAHLAHDLGQEFEQYFSRTVSLVTRVAADHDAAEVIEWSFTCLAWMFKYLSRLLVQDLRPLLEIMRPYLSHRKEYIARFSAESLAFLLRKASVLYSKRTEPLTLALTELLQPPSRDTQQTNLGTMTLLVESCLAVEAGVHSSTPFFIQGLLDVAAQLSYSPDAQTLLEGAFTSMVHRTDAQGFWPVMQVLLERMDRVPGETQPAQLSFLMSLMQVVVGTRSGTRITDWNRVLGTVGRISGDLKSHLEDTQPMRLVLATNALCLQYAPMDQLIPYSKVLLDPIVQRCPPVEFFAYCTITAELDPGRFRDLLLVRLQQYIASNFGSHELGLVTLLDELRRKGVTCRQRGRRGFIESSKAADELILGRFNDEGDTERLLEEETFVATMCLARSVSFPVDTGKAAAMSDFLLRDITEALRQAGSELTFQTRLYVGWGINMYADLIPIVGRAPMEILPAMANAPPKCFQLLPFVESFNRLGKVEALGKGLSYIQRTRATEILVQNLLNCSKELRTKSLQVLGKLVPPDSNPWLSGTTMLLLEISNVPYDPSGARTITMLLRRLPQIQKQAPENPTLQQLVPFFCLGSLPSYHEKTRKEACSVLRDVIVGSTVEDVAIQILTSWLRNPSTTDDSPAKPPVPAKMLSPFECSNLDRVRSIISQAFDLFRSPKEHLMSNAEEANRLRTVTTPYNARSIALEALKEMVSIIEKRSRQISPIFLSAQLARPSHEALDQSDTSVSSHTLSPEITELGWSFSDRRAFVSLVSDFQNPKVLYRAQEVHEKLLSLLGNGNAEIRKLSLTAILKWKDPVLQSHQQILYQVIDEKVVNAEIGIMLNAESDENPFRPEERPVIIPVLLRLLYGLVIGRSGTHGSQEARRKSILRMLFRMREEEVAIFLRIALGALKDVHLPSSPHAQSDFLDHEHAPLDQQYGTLRMLLTLIETLSSQFTVYGKYVLEPILYCTLSSCHQINAGGTSSESMLGNIRRTGLQCLIFLFANCDDLDWTPFMPLLFAEAISPRLERFAIQTAQGISGLLRLFSTWSNSIKQVSLFRSYDTRILSACLGILETDSAKSEVKEFVLKEILMPLVQLASDTTATVNPAEELLMAEIPTVLQSLGYLLQKTPSKDLLLPTTSILTDLSRFALASTATSSIIALLVDILATSRRQIPPHVRSAVLSAIQALLQADLDGVDPFTRDKLFDLVSRLFNYFKDPQSRQILCQILACLEGRFDKELTDLCFDLNAFSMNTLGEVDFDRRLRAFERVASLEVVDDTASRWQPILYNLLFFMRHDDFAIRSNAVSCLKGFIVGADKNMGPTVKKTLIDVLLASLLQAVKDDSEVLRADAVMLFGQLVNIIKDEPRFHDVRILLVGNDEEASFFTNILHVQQHRRLRAIRRLVAEVELGSITSDSLTSFFLPLLQKFVQDPSTDESAAGPKGESMTAMRIILQWVEWRQFKTTFLRYKSGLDGEQASQKVAIKMLSNAADALVSALKRKGQEVISEPEHRLPCLATSLPAESEFFDQVRTQLLPKLGDFARYRDEVEISSRLPIAVTAVKLTTLLPPSDLQLLAAPIILDVANVLRSRAQHSRDIARVALKEMVLLLGPGSLRLALGELRSALKRGYQLHVLSFTLHSLLVSLSPTIGYGELDYCLDEMVSVIMDDTFGAVGQEKDNQDYISDMKEVKSSKSFDSMELLARSTKVEHLKGLIEPITTVLTGTLRTKQTRQADELLRRIGVGLSRNPGAGTRELLVFAYQVIQTFYREKASLPTKPRTNQEINSERFLIQMSSNRKAESSTSSFLLYKIARFAIDLARSALQRHEDLLTAENVHGFLPVIGDSLIEAQEEVKISALRFLAAILKLRMPELDENAPTYVREATRVVQNANSTNDESAQAALKLVAAVLRERKSVQVRDSDVASLLQRITPDLEEPDRQGVSFNFVRAVMSRKYQVPAVYEVVDKIGVMMVTNQNKSSRDVARGVYVHFLIEYPQSFSRWAKQQKFLIKNLEYDYPEGRESVMNAINMLLHKTSGEVAQQLVSAFFMPILLRMANDDDTSCRDVAGACLAQLFEIADSSRRKAFLQPLEAWLSQSENPPLIKLAMQAFAIVFTSVREGLDPQIALAKVAIEEALKSPASDEGDLPGEALKLLLRMTEMHPSKVMNSQSAGLWMDVRGLLRHPFPSIQNTASRLVTMFFAKCEPETRNEVPLPCRYGLNWNEDALREVLKSTIRSLKHGSDDTNTVAILAFLGSCLDTNDMTMAIKRRPPLETTESEPESSLSSSDESTDKETTSIPAIHYLLHQLTLVLRHETASPTTTSLLPKANTLKLLNLLISDLRPSTLTPRITQPLLLPLLHLTNPNTYAPRSPDPSFAATYSALLQSAQELLTLLQEKVGDKKYISMMTEASKIARTKREERRRKRVIEKVADPEAAAKLKRRKGERTKERRREMGREWGERRKARGW